MNEFLVPVFYASVAGAALWLALLWTSSRREKAVRRRRFTQLAFGVTTILLLFVPFGGVPLWNRAFSFYPNPSLPVLGIVCAALWQRLFGLPVFKSSDWRAIWGFGAVAGSVLYLHPLVVGAADFYYWGWDRIAAIWILAGLAVALLAWGSRLGVLLLAALIAYAVTALESQNAWDYLVDPFYWLISLGVVATRGATALLRRVEAAWARRPAPLPVPAVEEPVVALEKL
jgi:hypothetical protein